MKSKLLSLVFASLLCGGSSFSAYVEEIEDSAVVQPLPEVSKDVATNDSSLLPVVRKNENALTQAGYTLLSNIDNGNLGEQVYYKVNKVEDGKKSSLEISQLNYQEEQGGSRYSISSYTLPVDRISEEEDVEKVVADFITAQQQEAKRKQEVLELRNQIINAQYRMSSGPFHQNLALRTNYQGCLFIMSSIW